jgi:hypothetical protein
MSDPLLFQGKSIYPQKSVYAILIFPLVWLKKLFQSLYSFLLKVMWAELIEGKKKDNELAGLFLFVIFLILSWLSYLSKVYFPIIFTLFLIVWFLDYNFAKSEYRKGKYTIPIKITDKGEERLLWNFALPHQKPLQTELSWGQIRALVIDHRFIYGGSFEEKIGNVWQISLQGFDGSEWVIDEEKTVTQAFNQVRIFTQWIDVPIIFRGSHGQNNYAEYPLDADIIKFLNTAKSGVQVQTNQQKWHIHSLWRLRHSWALIKQIFQDSGFILFLLVMSKVMLICGQIIDGVIKGFQGNVVILEFPNNLFSPSTLFPLLIAIAIMVYKGWQLSRVKHTYLDQNVLKVAIDNQVIGKLNTAEIKAVLLLANPESEILILTPKEAIIMPKLQTEEDSQLYLHYLQQGIEYFQQ